MMLLRPKSASLILLSWKEGREGGSGEIGEEGRRIGKKVSDARVPVQMCL
jgi:hypothetical protein